MEDISRVHQHMKDNPPPPPPTTFIQADAASFKQVVQTLTGPDVDDPIPPVKTTAQKKQGFKLFQRRNAIKNGLMIATRPSSRNPPEILSPSILDFPALALSPIAPLIYDEDNLSKPSAEEERAIAEKKFYLHSWRMTTPRDAKPRLLQLFPETSPLSGNQNA